jgi:hypothetical protein
MLCIIELCSASSTQTSLNNYGKHVMIGNGVKKFVVIAHIFHKVCRTSAREREKSFFFLKHEVNKKIRRKSLKKTSFHVSILVVVKNFQISFDFTLM